MKQQELEIARLTKPQGLKGGLRAQLYCDSPEVFERLTQSLDCFYLGEDRVPTKVHLNEVRKGFVILTIEDIDNVVAAENLVGEMLYVKREDFPLPEGSWFIADLIGLKVIDADSGKLYGKVQEILQNAPKDVYVIKTPAGSYPSQLLFPAVPEVLIDVDITEGVIKIRPLEGLFDAD